MRAFLTLGIITLLFSCQKKNDPSPQPSPQLKADSTTLTVSGSKNVLDSFTIQYSGKWTIAVNPSNATWLKTDVSSGTGNSKIYVSAQEDNTSGSARNATLVITPDRDATKSVDVAVSQKTFSPPSGIIWSKTYGGSGNDGLYNILKTSDGGYIALGKSGTAEGDVHMNKRKSDLWIVKLDSEGKILWEKSYGGSEDDNGGAMVQSGDGGYFISATSGSTDGDVSGNTGGKEIWIIKIDGAGNLLWKKNFGGNGTDHCELHSITNSPDGGCVVVAGTSSNDGDMSGSYGGGDTWIVKLDNQGNKMWSKIYGGSQMDLNTTIITVNDGYLVGGVTSSNDGDMAGNKRNDGWHVDAFVLKLDLNGGKVWVKTFGGSQNDWVADIKSTPDGGFIVAGGTGSNDGDVSNFHGGSSDAWVIKLDGAGNKVWQKTFGGSGFDEAVSVILTSDNGYLFSGSTQSSDGDITFNHGTSDAWVVKLDGNGNKLWQKSFGGTDSEFYGQNGIIATNDGNYMIIGATASNNGDITGSHGGSDGWIVKFKIQ